jgi:predicted TIM-barrel fold metal-dependent hydrolase
MQMVEHADMTGALASLRAPVKPLPTGACDAHAHIFGPYDRYPLLAARRYTPPLAPFEEYLAMLKRVGFGRGVVVQASANGFDNRGLLDALARGGGGLRGVAVVAPDTSLAELRALYDQGVRGLRFTDSGAIPGLPKTPESLDFEELFVMAPRLLEAGLHAELFAPLSRLALFASRLKASGVALVVGHLGMVGGTESPAAPEFQTLLDLVSLDRVWLKTSVLRNSRDHVAFADAKPFHDAVMAAAPDRTVWGSDWPFIGLGNALPNVGSLVDVVDGWIGDAARTALFVKNPERLYGFDGTI